MIEFPDYRGFRVAPIEISGDRQLTAFLEKHLRGLSASPRRGVRRLRRRLDATDTFLRARRGRLSVIVAGAPPLDTYDALLNRIDHLLNPRASRSVERLN
jgi:hypothetical protein